MRLTRCTQGSRTRLGFMLSPAWRAYEVDALYPGLADSPGLYAIARLAGL
jgi:hypothetical protein